MATVSIEKYEYGIMTTNSGKVLRASQNGPFYRGEVTIDGEVHAAIGLSEQGVKQELQKIEKSKKD